MYVCMYVFVHVVLLLLHKEIVIIFFFFFCKFLIKFSIFTIFITL